MGCFVLRKYYLQYLEGKINQYGYEFCCTSQNQTKQNEGDFFTIDLNQLFPHLQQDKSKQTPNILVGIIYDYRADIAQKVQSFITECIRNSIYFKLGQYQDAFDNIISSTYDYMYSTDISNSLELRASTFFNFLMKVNNNIYLSKIRSEKLQQQNKWCIRINRLQYKEVDMKNDLVELSKNSFQIKQEISKKISEIILSNSYCTTDVLVSDVRKLSHVQKVTQSNIIYFLKIKGLNENQ